MRARLCKEIIVIFTRSITQCTQYRFSSLLSVQEYIQRSSPFFEIIPEVKKIQSFMLSVWYDYGMVSFIVVSYR